MSERQVGLPAPQAEANFVLRMRLLREAQGISQAEIAARLVRLGIALPQQTIARIETGKRGVRLDEAAGIARVLSVDLAEMLSDPVEVRDARTQLAEAIEALNRAHDDRYDAQAAFESLEREATVLATDLRLRREEEARLAAVVARLRAAVEELDEGKGEGE